MVRSHLIEQLVIEHPELDPQSIDAAVKAFFDQITGHLGKGGRVELRGVGVFSVRMLTEQVVRNPRTGERLAKPEMPRPFFRPGKPLAKRIRNHG
jgi:integration host factor subunit beta